MDGCVVSVGMDAGELAAVVMASEIPAASVVLASTVMDTEISATVTLDAEVPAAVAILMLDNLLLLFCLLLLRLLSDGLLQF